MRRVCMVLVVAFGVGSAYAEQGQPAADAAALKARVLDLAGGWLERAEAGDVVPILPKGVPLRRVTPAFQVRPQVVDQARAALAAGVTRVTATPVTTAAGGTEQSQALLASQSPASVIVGVRLEQTRIVGNPGAVGAGTVRFNPQAGGLLGLFGIR